MGPFALGRDALPVGSNILDSTARTATTTSDNFGTLGASGLIVVIDVTAVAATPSVVFTIQGVCYPNGPSGAAVVWTLLASAAVTATGVTVLQVHPDLAAAANTKADELVPETVRILATHADTDSITYSVHAILTP